jgi:uncharacterized membrane protein
MTTQKRTVFNVVLVVSILMNMFLMGILAAQLLHLRPPFMVPPSPIHVLKHAARGLSPESQKRVEDIIAKHDAVFKKGMGNAGAFFTQIQAILTAETFDKKVFDDLRMNMQRSDSILQNEMAKMVSEIAETLTTAERQEFFKFLSDMPLPPSPPATEK